MRLENNTSCLYFHLWCEEASKPVVRVGGGRLLSESRPCLPLTLYGNFTFWLWASYYLQSRAVECDDTKLSLFYCFNNILITFLWRTYLQSECERESNGEETFQESTEDDCNENISQITFHQF